MRKEHRYIIYFAVFIVVMMLPQLFEIIIYFYKKFEVIVVKEYFWTSVSLATYSGAYPFNFRWRIQSQNRVK